MLGETGIDEHSGFVGHKPNQIVYVGVNSIPLTVYSLPECFKEVISPRRV